MRERRHDPCRFAFDPERLSAGRQHGQLGRRAEQTIDEHRRRVDDVFAVVENEKGRSRTERVTDYVRQLASRSGSNLQNGGDGLRHFGAARDRRELHPPYSARKYGGLRSGNFRGELARESCLSSAARASEREQSCAS